MIGGRQHMYRYNIDGANGGHHAGQSEAMLATWWVHVELNRVGINHGKVWIEINNT